MKMGTLRDFTSKFPNKPKTAWCFQAKTLHSFLISEGEEELKKQKKENEKGCFNFPFWSEIQRDEMVTFPMTKLNYWLTWRVVHLEESRNWSDTIGGLQPHLQS